MSNLISKITRQPAIFWIIVVFFLALFFRLYNLPHHIAYHQDQVRDLNYMLQHFKQHQFIYLGPRASVGIFYLPPFWYYLMAIVYPFSQSPLAPAIMVAVLSSLTAPLIYWFVAQFFHKKIGIISALVYVVSPFSIDYSRFAWNPNPEPLFTTLTFVGMYYYVFRNKSWGFYVGLISANLALQLHYQGFITALSFIVILFVYKKLTIQHFISYLLINFLLLLPFLIYDYQHHFQNFEGIYKFIVHTKNNQNQKFFGVPFFIKYIFIEFSDFLGEVLFFKNKIAGLISTLIIFLSFILIRFKTQKEQILQYSIIFMFLVLFIYHNSLQQYFFLFLLPLIIIYFVFLVLKLPTKIAYFLLGIIIIVNIVKSPAFGLQDITYTNIHSIVSQITKNTSYCVNYDIFKDTFIEEKFRYLFSIAKSQPKEQNCEKIYYICQKEACHVENRFLNKKIRDISTSYIQVFEVTP